jgi:hypothetical protein
MKTSFRSRLAALVLLAALLEIAFLGLRRLLAPPPDVVGVIAMALAASVVYLAAARLAWRWAEPGRAALGVVLLASVLFRATLFPLPPTLSNDLYRYQWDAAVQRAGHNPYRVTPADPALAGSRPVDSDRLPGKNAPAAYGPLTELLFRLAAGLDGLFAFKLLSVLFDLGTLVLLVGLLRARREPPLRALLYGWCPLVVVEFAGSGHNDSLALAALLVANFFIIRQRAGVSIAALAGAVMAKWFPAVAAPVFFRRAGWRGLLFFSGIAVLCALPYGDAGWSLFSGLAAYARAWRNNSSLYDVLTAATGEESLAAGVGLGVVAGLVAHCWRERTEPLRASYLLLAALLLVSPNVFPWYVTWLVPFLCFYPNPGLLAWTATVWLGYHVLVDYPASGAWRYTPALVWLEYLPVYALLSGQWIAARSRRSLA